jgi:hypothetical protein
MSQLASIQGVSFAVMNGMRRSLLAICLFFATACLGQSPATPTPLDREVILAAGKTTALTATLSIRFIAVIGDSRCPINALCIQGGDAIVRIEIISRTARGERDLHTGHPQPVEFDGVEVQLVELTPYPFSGRMTDPEDYRATVRVTR